MEKRAGIVGETRSEATSGRLLVMLEGSAMLLLSLRSSRPSLLAFSHLTLFARRPLISAPCVHV